MTKQCVTLDGNGAAGCVAHRADDIAAHRIIPASTPQGWSARSVRNLRGAAPVRAGG